MKEEVLREISFEFTRSRGAGGQHVNRTESVVILRWNVLETKAYASVEKERLLKNLEPQLTKEGELLIRAETHRDQEGNRREALRRLQEILKKALFVPKKRIKTKPTKASQRKRLESKKAHAQKKRFRTEKW